MKRAMPIALFALLCGCHEKDARQLLVETDQACSQAASEGKDVDKIVSCWADDATIVPSGGPIISGKTAIRRMVKGSFATPGFKIRSKTLRTVVSSDGTMGYTTGETSITFPGQAGELQTQTVRSVAIWRRADDGRWKNV